MNNLTNGICEYDNANYSEQKIPIFMINKWTNPPFSKLLVPDLDFLLKCV